MECYEWKNWFSNHCIKANWNGTSHGVTQSRILFSSSNIQIQQPTNVLHEYYGGLASINDSSEIGKQNNLTYPQHAVFVSSNGLIGSWAIPSNVNFINSREKGVSNKQVSLIHARTYIFSNETAQNRAQQPNSRGGSRKSRSLALGKTNADEEEQHAAKHILKRVPSRRSVNYAARKHAGTRSPSSSPRGDSHSRAPHGNARSPPPSPGRP